MLRINLLLAVGLQAVCFSSCSQTTSPGHASPAGIFMATTPYNDVSKKLLLIASDAKYDMIKWSLDLQQDPETQNPTTYKLIVKYGMAKQASRDFMPGAETIELNGKWIMEKVLTENAAVIVYILNTENSPVSLSFLQVGPNLIHLLDTDRHMVVGTSAWSFTLNRVDPISAASSTLSIQTSSLPPLQSDSLIVGVFDGRTPCNNDLLALNGISSNGCQIIKCRLTLYQDIKTHTPTTFLLQTIYVGKGDNKYTSTGKWTMTKGTATDNNAIVYQLELGSGKLQSLSFMKADDSILFMLDTNRNLLVGNEYVGFTLNRIKR